MERELRILIVEDVPADADLAEWELRKDGIRFTAMRVETKRGFIEALEGFRPDLVLSDFAMPEFDGMQALKLSLAHDPDLPFLVLTGLMNEETAVACMKAGATDYIIKEHIRRIPLAVRGAIKNREIRREKAKSENELGTIAEIGRMFGSTLEIDGVYDRAATEIQKLIPCDSLMVNLSNAEQDTLTVAYASGLEMPGRNVGDSFPMRGTVLDEMIRTKRGVVVQSENPGELIGKFPSLVVSVRAGIHSIMSVPLISQDRLIGNMIMRSKKPNAFTGKDLQLAETIGEQIAGAVANAQLFGDLRKADRSLRENERLMVTLMGNLPGMVYRCNLDEAWTMRFVSEGCQSLTGHPPEDLLASRRISYADLIHPDDRSRVWEEVNQAITENRPFTLEYRIVDAAGATKWVWEKGCAILGSGGAVGVVEGFITDITERKQAEEQCLQTLESLRKAVSTTIQVMVSAVETRDPYTAGHQLRAADIARAIATEMGLPHEKIDGIRLAGSIHDIGKLSIPAEILSKPTKLSAIEFSLIKEHARKGYEMLKDVESPWPLAEIVFQHHERMDGSGYPRGLKGEEMLIESRILAVADVVEAMASHRPYRPGLGIEAALNEIEQNRGAIYDGAVADACLRLFREKGFNLEKDDYAR